MKSSHSQGGPWRSTSQRPCRGSLGRRRSSLLEPASRAARSPRVLVAGKLNAQLAPGGGEVQMQRTIEALAAQQLRVRPWRPWEDAWTDIDVLHLFGSHREHLELIHSAQQRGVRVALSPIAWFSSQACWGEARPLATRLAAWSKYQLRAYWPGCPSWRRKLYHAVDHLLPNSQAEAEQLVELFQVPRDRITVVPNGVDERFATADPRWFSEHAGVRDFVLYAGRIEPRKNQLGFLRAMRGSGLNIVVLGDVVPGHESYASACRRAADDQVHFISRLAHDDPRLASAYAASRCLALCSWFETPGLVALEAALQGLPLVLPEYGSAREYFGDLARYVKPNDHAQIRAAVEAAYDQARDPRRVEHVRQHYTWDVAARVTANVYGQLCD